MNAITSAACCTASLSFVATCCFVETLTNRIRFCTIACRQAQPPGDPMCFCPKAFQTMTNEELKLDIRLRAPSYFVRRVGGGG